MALKNLFFVIFTLLTIVSSCNDEDEMTASSDTFRVIYKGKNDSCGNHKLLFSEEDVPRLAAIHIMDSTLFRIGEHLSGNYRPDQLIEVRIRRLLEGDTKGCESLASDTLSYVYVLTDYPVN